MLTVISPAKTLDFESEPVTRQHSQPARQEASERIMRKLRSLSRKKIGELMKISPQLAELNYHRFADWEASFNLESSKQAVLAFRGDVYLGLEAETFTEEDFDFAQTHLRILSGLHGMLKPLDLIRPYRLEMGTRIKIGRKNNLYEFWGSQITEELRAQLEGAQEQVLLNLASNEYFNVIQPQDLGFPVVTPVFKDWKNDQFKVLSFFAKKARGKMSSWIIRNRIDRVEQVKDFDGDGYQFNPTLSDEKTWTFTRRQD